jgi:hypothetical protein
MAVQDYTDLINQASMQNNVDPRLLQAQIQIESGGNPAAYNASTGATGLGQQIPATAKALGIDPTDPAQSINGMARQMAENIQRYGDVDKAVLAYHGGTDPRNWGPKTQDYLQKVSNAFQGQQVPQQAPQPVSNDPLDQLLAQQAAGKSAPQATQAAPQPSADPLDQMLAQQASGNVPRGTNLTPTPQPQAQDTNSLGMQDVQNDEKRLMQYGGLGRFAAGAAQGVTDTGQFLGKGARLVGNTLGLVPDSEVDSYFKAANQAEQTYAQNRQASMPQNLSGLITGQKPAPGTDWGRIVGQVIGPGGVEAGVEKLGAAGASALGRAGLLDIARFTSPAAQRVANVLSNAYRGAGTAALSSEQSNASLPSQLGIGAAAGAVLPAVLGPLGNIAAKYLASDAPAVTNAAAPIQQTIQKNAAPILNAIKTDAQGATTIDASALPSDVQDLLTNGPLKSLPPEQQARVLTYGALGVNSYPASAISRDYGTTATESNLAQNVERGQPLRDTQNAMQQQLLASANRAQNVMGAAPQPFPQMGSTIRGYFAKQANNLDGQINAAYQAADQQAGGAPQVTTNPIIQSLQANRSQFLAKSEGKSLLNGIRARLQDFSGGPPQTPGTPVIQDANGDTLLSSADVPPKMTFTDSENFRKYLNSVWTPENSGLLGKIKQSVDQAQDSAGAGQIYQQARALNQQRAQTFENNPAIAAMLSTAKGGTPRVADEKIVNNLLNTQSADQLNTVMGELNKTPEGQQIASQLRASVMQNAVNNAVAKTPGETGAGAFSGLKFGQQLDKIGPKMNVLFNSDQQNYLGALRRGAIDLTTVPPQRPGFNPPGTAAQSQNLIDTLAPQQPQTVLGKIGTAAANKAPWAGALIGGGVGHAPGAAIGMGAGEYLKGAAERSAQKAADEALAARVSAASNPLNALAGKGLTQAAAQQQARALMAQRLQQLSNLGGALQPANAGSP